MGIARSSWLFAESGYERTRSTLGSSISSRLRVCFAEGERIRLEIASSAFPLYDRNPGSDVPSCRATSWDWQRSTQSCFTTGNVPRASVSARKRGRRMTKNSSAPQIEFATP
jgi:uncharacterized protein